jgi:hypothetical protein
MSTDSGTSATQARCPRCGSDNRCGMRGEAPCWCADPSLGRLAPDPALTACYCKTCLERLLAEQAGRTT